MHDTISAGSVSAVVAEAKQITAGRGTGFPSTISTAKQPLSIFTVAQILSSSKGKFSNQLIASTECRRLHDYPGSDAGDTKCWQGSGYFDVKIAEKGIWTAGNPDQWCVSVTWLF